nr:hypothetical protein [Limosilactobacillus balticus]
MTQLEQKRHDLAVKQKRGLHFIAASVIIWLAIAFIYSSAVPILTKNLFVQASYYRWHGESQKY